MRNIQLERRINKAIKEALNNSLLNEYDYSAGRGSIASVDMPSHREKKDSNFISNPNAFNNSVIEHITDSIDSLKNYVYPKFGNNAKAKELITKCISSLTKIKEIFPLKEGFFSFGKNKKKKEQKENLDTIITDLTWIVNTALKNTKVIKQLGEAKVTEAIKYISKTIELLGGNVALDDTYSNDDIMKQLKQYIQNNQYDEAISYLKKVKKANNQ